MGAKDEPSALEDRISQPRCRCEAKKIETITALRLCPNCDAGPLAQIEATFGTAEG